MTFNENVRRLNIRAAETASDSTDLLALSQIFLSDTVGAFTIDLADSRYFIQRSSPGQVVRDNLGGGNEVPISNVFPITQTFASYRDVPFLYLVDATVGGRIVILNPNPQISSRIDGVTAMTLYRSVRQPLPGQLAYLYSKVSCCITV